MNFGVCEFSRFAVTVWRLCFLALMTATLWQYFKMSSFVFQWKARPRRRRYIKRSMFHLIEWRSTVDTWCITGYCILCVDRFCLLLLAFVVLWFIPLYFNKRIVFVGREAIHPSWLLNVGGSRKSFLHATPAAIICSLGLSNWPIPWSSAWACPGLPARSLGQRTSNPKSPPEKVR